MKTYKRLLDDQLESAPSVIVEMVTVNDIYGWLIDRDLYVSAAQFRDEVRPRRCKECGASKPQEPHYPRSRHCPGCDGEVPPFMALNIHKVGQAVCPVCELELTVAKR